MSYCLECKAAVKGKWIHCPLCGCVLDRHTTDIEQGPFPHIPLRFNREKGFRLLMIFTLISGILFLGIEALWLDQSQVLQLAVFGIMSLWIVVAILIRKRRNIAKSILYLLVMVSLISVYLDYSLEWNGWSTTYVIPVICIFTDLALSISVKIIFPEVADYILYLLIVAGVGLLPALFLIFDWTTNSVPSLLSIAVSTVMFVSLLIHYRKIVLYEWKKRMQF